MARLAFTADNHIGGYLRKRKELEDESYTVLDLMAPVINEQKPDAVVFGGDVFDRKTVSGWDIQRFNMFREDVKAPLYSIIGNHDEDRLDKVFALGGKDNLDHTYVEIKGAKICGLDYSIDNKKALQDVEACDILVMHTPFKHLLGFKGAYKAELDDIPGYVQNVFCGDVHTVDKTPLPGDRGYFISPGAMYAAKIDETGPKGFWMYDSEKEDPWEFIEIPHREIRRYEQEDLEQLLEEPIEIRYPELKPVIEVSYDIENQETIDLLKKELPDYIFIESPYKKSALGLEDTITEEELAEENKTTMVDMLPFCVKKQDPKYRILSDLLTGHPKEEVFEAFEFMKGT